MDFITASDRFWNAMGRETATRQHRHDLLMSVLNKCSKSQLDSLVELLDQLSRKDPLLLYECGCEYIVSRPYRGVVDLTLRQIGDLSVSNERLADTMDLATQPQVCNDISLILMKTMINCRHLVIEIQPIRQTRLKRVKLRPVDDFKCRN